jgi:hypothetical protein
VPRRWAPPSQLALSRRWRTGQFDSPQLNRSE